MSATGCPRHSLVQLANCRPATWIFCAVMCTLPEGSSGEFTVAATCTLPIRAAGSSPSAVAVANASDLPSAAPSMVSFGHSPRTRNRPVRLPCVSGTQSLSDAIASSTVALMASPCRAVHRHPALARAHAQAALQLRRCCEFQLSLARERPAAQLAGQCRDVHIAARALLFQRTSRREIEVDSARPLREKRARVEVIGLRRGDSRRCAGRTPRRHPRSACRHAA